ncbi:MAG: molybdenum cofactor guanylyltransferase MobA [Rudaea sp.]
MSAPNPINVASITVAILAGGEGRRLGGLDKGLQPICGKPMIAHVIDALAGQYGELIICANRNEDEYARFATVSRDDVPGFRGPLAGIATALLHCRTPWLLTASVDAPRPPRHLAARLIAARDGIRPVVANDGVRRQPLFALYSRDLATAARDALDRNLAVWRWQDELDAIEVDFSDEPERFRNLNTPEDFAQWEQLHRE